MGNVGGEKGGVGFGVGLVVGGVGGVGGTGADKEVKDTVVAVVE